MAYESFRSPAVPSFQEAYSIKIEASRDSHANGDYSDNAYRGTVLGLMRLAKMAAWKDEHLYWCQVEYESHSVEEQIPF